MNFDKPLELGKEVALIYCCKLNRILFYQRENIPTIPEPGKWSIFGGVVESGETHREALERELKEELNVPITNIEYLGMAMKGRQTLHFYRGNVDAHISDIRITEGCGIDYIEPIEIERDTRRFEPAVMKYFLENKDRILSK